VSGINVSAVVAQAVLHCGRCANTPRLVSAALNYLLRDQGGRHADRLGARYDAHPVALWRVYLHRARHRRPAFRLAFSGVIL
jgi:hypothetical protein